MQIQNNTLIAECSAYDFKEMLERKKVKSWLKSVSAFANTEGGSLFYGVNDDGVIVGLENPQSDADFISEMMKARLDPVPEVQLIPIEHEGHTLLEVKVKAGTLTPYYYYQDGTRTAYVRVGNESVECNSQQLLSLVLKGTHMTWDSLPTQVDAGKHSFIILANTFREQTHQEWNDKYLESFGLVTPDGKLTNAGLLFVDNCTVFQSRIFCTRWTGLYKDDAISSVEHRANLVLLLKYGMDFIKNYTMSGWVKMPNYRLNLPDYSDRAIFEGLVNHLIHRDYTIMGGEVHIDIYDDRVELVSPGAMLDGTQIQDRDIYKVPSMRRNPVIADVFTQLDYMEKRGSGLRKMRELTEKLPNFLQGKEPQYQTEATSFYTTFYNLNWNESGRIPVEEVANRVNSTLEKYPVNEESSVEKFGVNTKEFGVNQESSVEKFGVNADKFGATSETHKKVSKTAHKIIDLVISDPSITADNMANKIGVTKRAIEKNIKSLRVWEFWFTKVQTRLVIGALLLNHKQNNKPMETSFIPLCAIIAVLIIAFLFASLPQVNHKTRYKVLYAIAIIMLLAVIPISEYMASDTQNASNNYLLVLIFDIAVGYFCMYIAALLKFNVLKRKNQVLENALTEKQQENVAILLEHQNEKQQALQQRELEWLADKITMFTEEEQKAILASACAFAEHGLIITPSITIQLKDTCSQQDLMYFVCSTFFNMGKKRSDIVSFLSQTFPLYFPAGESVLAKKMPGVEKLKEMREKENKSK